METLIIRPAKNGVIVEEQTMRSARTVQQVLPRDIATVVEKEYVFEEPQQLEIFLRNHFNDCFNSEAMSGG